MIRLGLRLAVAGGREAVIRLVVIAAAVALGVGVLLVSLAGINAVHAQSVRTAWLSTSTHNRRPSVNEAASDPVWGALVLDQFGSSIIERVELAPTGPRSPVPPGVPRLPGPGQFYASPALARLLASTPRAQLADRFPGRQVDIIGKAALASPDDLVIIIGYPPAQLSQDPRAREVRSFETAAQGTPGNAHPGRMQLILAVVAGSLLFPVMIFIAAATRLSAARREQRFAAMRLVGATPRQVSVLASADAAIAAAAGVIGGVILFFAFRPLVAAIPFSGQPFYPSDLTLSLADLLAVVVGVPVAAAIAARVALQRVQISPLGVARRVTPPTPQPWRALPLLAGLAELGYFIGRRPATTTGQVRAYGAGFLLIMIGLVLAGPWLTMVGSRVMARRARRPATLIAGRRLADNPRAAFRAVSGLVIALFVSSAALGIISTILSYQSTSTGGAATRHILTTLFQDQPLSIGGQQVSSAVAIPAGLLAQLDSIPGVGPTVVVHVDPSSDQLAPASVGGPPVSATSGHKVGSAGHPVGQAPAPGRTGAGGNAESGPAGNAQPGPAGLAQSGPAGNAQPGPASGLQPVPLGGLIACADLARTPALGRCVPGGEVASFPLAGTFGGITNNRAPLSSTVWPSSPVPLSELATLPASALDVSTDGSAPAIEAARTAIEAAFPYLDSAPATIGDISAANAQLVKGWRQLADLAIVASLVIAACSLAVSVAAGLIDRKRPFSLLRLGGAQLAVLRRVVALEAALPLLLVAAAAASAGLLAADLFLRSQLKETLQAPGGGYYAAVGAGLVLALAIVAATLPLLERITGPETARNE